VIWLGALGWGMYAMIGVHVGYSVAESNRGLLPRFRLSPWLRGALWPVFVTAGFLLTLLDYLLASGADKRRR
jgi:choline-glycine betaine transporter